MSSLKLAGFAVPMLSRKLAGFAVPTSSLRSVRFLPEFWIACTTLFLLLASGCAGVGLSPGQRLLRSGQHEAAVQVLREDSEAHPDDPWRRRDYAVALLEAGRPSDALEMLRDLRVRVPRDATTAFHFARAAEASGDLDAALEGYQTYLRLDGRGREEIAARLQSISLKRAELVVRRAIAKEDSLAAVDVPENAVAVPDFANPAAVDTLRPLGRGLAALLISDLTRFEELRVVERSRVRVLLDELALAAPPQARETELPPPDTPEGVQARLAKLLRPSDGRPYYEGTAPVNTWQDPVLLESVRSFQRDQALKPDGIVGPRTLRALEQAWSDMTATRPDRPAPLASPAVDPRTAPRLGRLLGARRFVQGTFLPLPENRVQLDAGILEVAGGPLLGVGEPLQGRLPEVLRLAKTLSIQTLEALGVRLTEKDRRLLEEVPTDDFLAFLAYGRGLELEDAGRPEEAAFAYREAVERDPSFIDAAWRLRVASVSDAGQEKLNRNEVGRLGRPIEVPRETVVRQAVVSGFGPGPEEDPGAEDDPSSTDPVRAGGGEAGIVIEGEVPGGNR